MGAKLPPLPKGPNGLTTRYQVIVCGSGPGARVVLLVDVNDARFLHMGVYFRCRHVVMSEQHLHRAQVGSALKKMRGERVAKGMRRNVGLDPGFGGIAPNQLPDADPGESLA